MQVTQRAHWVTGGRMYANTHTHTNGGADWMASGRETKTAIVRPATGPNLKDDNLWTSFGRNHIIQNYLLANEAVSHDMKRYTLPTDTATTVVVVVYVSISDVGNDENGEGAGRQTTRPANFCQIK